MKRLLILILIFFAFTASASQIIYLPKEEGFFAKIWRCKLNISCYKEKQLGSTITTINATDKISDSRAVINTNFSNLNLDKIENSTTSVAAITTLSNLATVGTITSGTWNGTTLTVARGGTGSTTLSSNQVLLGNGTGNIKIVAGLGTSGQFLTSNGASLAPTWTTSAVDQGIAYNWTGAHDFNATTTMATTTLDGRLGVGTTTPGYELSVNGDVFINSGLGVGIATTSDGNLLVKNYLRVEGNIHTKGKVQFSDDTTQSKAYGTIYATSSAAVTGSTSQGVETSATVFCLSGDVVSGGGFDRAVANNSSEEQVVESKPSGTTGWIATIRCVGASCTADTITATAICLDL